MCGFLVVGSSELELQVFNDALNQAAYRGPDHQHVSTGADYFNSYSMSSYSEYYRNASLYAASFDSTRIELQFLNLYGRVDNSTQHRQMRRNIYPP